MKLDGICISKFCAFTLAEVLLTLGIIGIVAALTIPTLINKVEKEQYVVALKKEYSSLNSGFERILADEGVNELSDTAMFQSLGHNSVVNSSDDYFFSTAIYNTYLKKYFKLTTAIAPNGYKISDLDGSYNVIGASENAGDYSGKKVFLNSDGSVIFYMWFVSNTSDRTDVTTNLAGGHISKIGNIQIDVNGFNKPNKFGRDVFSFIVSGYGKIYPVGGEYEALATNGSMDNYWQNYTRACGDPYLHDETFTNAYGFGCSARIIENGWQMDY